MLAALYLPPPPAPENPNTAGAIGPAQDDISLLWLKPGADVTAAVSALEASGTPGIGLGQIFYGPSLETMFNAPGLPSAGGDPRTPDIIVQPNVGVIYTGSKKKQTEHGGFANDYTNVMMLVSNPNFGASTITSFVETTQVAPTILKALGLDPNQLDGVQERRHPRPPGIELGAGVGVSFLFRRVLSSTRPCHHHSFLAPTPADSIASVSSLPARSRPRH